MYQGRTMSRFVIDVEERQRRRVYPDSLSLLLDDEFRTIESSLSRDGP